MHLSFRSAEVNGTKTKSLRTVREIPHRQQKSQARIPQTLLGSQFVYIGVLSDDFAAVDFRKDYANLSLPKEAKFKRCRTIKTNERKPCAAEKRQPVPKRVSGDGSAPPRFLVAVNFALQAACFRNPPVLLRYVSSSQKIFALQIFFGSPVCLVFRVVLVVFSVACAWLRRPSAKREGLWCGDSRTTMPKSRTCLCQAHAMVPNG